MESTMTTTTTTTTTNNNNNNNNLHIHRSNLSSRNRSAKKSSLKRSKSLHCSKQRLHELQPHHYDQLNDGSYSGSVSPWCSALSHTQAKSVCPQSLAQYANRRHHSTTDYSAALDQCDSFPFVVNSSSHNLYYQFQNDQPSPPIMAHNTNTNTTNAMANHNTQRGSCSSGTSVGSGESYHNQSINGSRKPSDYFEDVFYENSQTVPPPNLHRDTTTNAQHLATKMGSLSLINGHGSESNGHFGHQSSTAAQSGQTYHNCHHQRNGSHRRPYNGSSSSSSLYNGHHPSTDLSVFLDAFDACETVGGDEFDNGGQWADDFTLEPLPESGFSRDRSSSGPVITPRLGKRSTSSSQDFSSSSSSSTSSSSTVKCPYRFYLIKQRNYPPLYLENVHNRRRIYRILVLGYPSSGKTSLIDQFSVHLDQCDRARFNPASAIELNDRSNLLIHFLESDSFDKYLLQMPVTDYQPDVYLILYSANNRDSFNSVKKTLVDLQRWDDVETKSIIIVANKSDLVRGRCVTRREGRELACANNCKYIETSCTISHNVDVLLQGIGSQICLKEQQMAKHKELEQLNGSKMKRKPSFFKRILRKTAINKSKSCDNLHVL